MAEKGDVHGEGDPLLRALVPLVVDEEQEGAVEADGLARGHAGEEGAQHLAELDRGEGDVEPLEEQRQVGDAALEGGVGERGAGELDEIAEPAEQEAGGGLAAGAGALPPTSLILSGVVVSSFCSALVMFLASVSPAGRVQGALYWLMGSLAAPPPGILPVVTGGNTSSLASSDASMPSGTSISGTYMDTRTQNDVAEVLDDPQVKHLDLIEEVEHPKAGKLRFVGGPVHFDNLARDKAAPPPLVGEHSEKILRELGHDDAAIEALMTQHVSQIAR